MQSSTDIDALKQEVLNYKNALLDRGFTADQIFQTILLKKEDIDQLKTPYDGIRVYLAKKTDTEADDYELILVPCETVLDSPSPQEQSEPNAQQQEGQDQQTTYYRDRLEESHRVPDCKRPPDCKLEGAGLVVKVG